MSRTYESERTVDRAGVATVLSGVADGVLAGAVELGDGDEAVSVDVPEEVDLEVELETEDGETSLEVELEWDAERASESVRAEQSPGEGERGGEDAERTGGGADVDPPVPVGAAAPVQSLARFEVFEDRAAEWRWRLRHRNGNIIATSGEGYTQKHNARKGIRSVVTNAPGADVVGEPPE